MWPLAECISSLLVWTPSLQLGVLQSLHGSFLLRPILLSHLALSYLWWKPGQRHTSPPLSTTRPKLGIREWTPLQNCNIMTDCDQEQIVARLAVYSQNQVLLCTWHVLYVIQSHFQTDQFPDLWALIKKLIHTSDLAEFNRILDKISSDLAFSQSSFKHFSTQWLSLVHMWSGNSWKLQSIY